MAATQGNAARILRWHGGELPPFQASFTQLAAELEPALTKNGRVQAELGPNTLTRLLECACRRLDHVSYLQVLDARHPVVLTDHGRGLDRTWSVSDRGNESCHTAPSS